MNFCNSIQNEFRAVEKLCRDLNNHLVAVYRHGKLLDSPYYFIDMELCDMNLDQYIHREQSHGVDLSRLNVIEIWVIMRDISNGVAFIHYHLEVHRDIKPTNSMLSFLFF